VSIRTRLGGGFAADAVLMTIMCVCVVSMWCVVCVLGVGVCLCAECVYDVCLCVCCVGGEKSSNLQQQQQQQQQFQTENTKAATGSSYPNSIGK
jgi:hypothetical protein